ncbi:cingulin, putative [Entamoeba dispar SAW760]|uniref:Cingulin, putative n=1 Tax=Entamoeba dispar (strain ATCC PRA-260 / SAW760) TaxID=370354 RepID=B0EQM7_ENTDS|nr:cingulin, putative [Entamoeba dispar SAW760]EDR23146.1 cingulin, putative [Entamoeba dispar SAW760]|eukprot:EDR23146.1 cingulin, putative [Entamoeba dispar SAW760]
MVETVHLSEDIPIIIESKKVEEIPESKESQIGFEKEILLNEKKPLVMSTAKALRVVNEIKEKLIKIEEYNNLIYKKAKEFSLTKEKTPKQQQIEIYERRTNILLQNYNKFHETNERLQSAIQLESKKKQKYENDLKKEDELETKFKEVLKDLNNSQQQVNEIVQRIRDEEYSILELMEQKEDIERSVDEIQSRKEVSEEEMKGIKQKEDTNNNIFQEKKSLLEQEENNINNEIKEGQKKLNELKEHKEHQQIVIEEENNQMKSNINKLQSDLKEEQIEGNKIKKQIDEVKLKKEELQRKYEEFINKNESTLQPIENNLTEIQQEYDELTSQESIDKRNKTKESITSLKEQLKEIEQSNQEMQKKFDKMIEEEEKKFYKEKEEFKRKTEQYILELERSLSQIDPEKITGYIEKTKIGIQLDRKKTDTGLSNLLRKVEGKELQEPKKSDKNKTTSFKTPDEIIQEEKEKMKKLIQEEKIKEKEFTPEEREELKKELESKEDLKKQNEKKEEELNRWREKIESERQQLDLNAAHIRKAVEQSSSVLNEVFGTQITKIDETLIIKIEEIKRRLETLKKNQEITTNKNTPPIPQIETLETIEQKDTTILPEQPLTTKEISEENSNQNISSELPQQVDNVEPIIGTTQLDTTEDNSKDLELALTTLQYYLPLFRMAEHLKRSHEDRTNKLVTQDIEQPNQEEKQFTTFINKQECLDIVPPESPIENIQNTVNNNSAEKTNTEPIPEIIQNPSLGKEGIETQEEKLTSPIEVEQPQNTTPNTLSEKTEESTLVQENLYDTIEKKDKESIKQKVVDIIGECIKRKEEEEKNVSHQNLTEPINESTEKKEKVIDVIGELASAEQNKTQH